MQIKVLAEYGLEYALLGLSLNKGQPIENMFNVAQKLSSKDKGHNKNLESIVVYLDINTKRYFWSQLDTYRIGMSKQSQSTMHTLLKRELTTNDFSDTTDPRSIEIVNEHIRNKDLEKAKASLPEGFLQRRIVCTNYKTLRNIYQQRKNHRLNEWKIFCDFLIQNLKYPYFLGDNNDLLV